MIASKSVGNYCLKHTNGRKELLVSQVEALWAVTVRFLTEHFLPELTEVANVR